MNIPDAAVEAVMKAIYEAGIDTFANEPYRKMAIAALGAATPYLAARRTVTTVGELEELPFGSVILDPAGLSLHKNEFTGWIASNGARNIDAEMLEREALPATVLHEPRSAGAGEPTAPWGSSCTTTSSGRSLRSRLSFPPAWIEASPSPERPQGRRTP